MKNYHTSYEIPFKKLLMFNAETLEGDNCLEIRVCVAVMLP